jgi:hypothetical protein
MRTSQSFDPARIIDRATIEEPARHSEGVLYVLVNGIVVVKDGKLQDGVTPGRMLRAEARLTLTFVIGTCAVRRESAVVHHLKGAACTLDLLRTGDRAHGLCNQVWAGF